MVTGIQLRLLGPVQLLVDGQLAELGPARQRTVLAALAVDAGRPVPVDVLVDRVWGEDPPAGVRSGMYSYVSKLRRAFDRAELPPSQVGLANRPGGYVLDVDPLVVDLHRFRQLARSAAEPGPPGDHERRARLLDEALELWNGPALADLLSPWAAGTRELLAQQRVDAVLCWAQAYLASGQPGRVIGGLRELAALHPLVEPLAARLIEALCRDNRPAEALDYYAHVRERVIEELGIEPGAELRGLHAAILREDSNPLPVTASTPGTAMPTCTLPPDTGVFTGRVQETEKIIAGVDEADGQGRVLSIHAIDGMPGVGKTALAVHVAHELAHRFPDLQVFVDLQGHTAGRPPASSAEVLAMLLSADGVDGRHLPEGVDARSAMWRRRMAGRRALVVLDNAADTAQVAPLLPGAPGCLVLVTSRRFLGDLPADVLPVPVNVLPADEAETMFLRLAPQAADDPAAVRKMVAASGFLPLAISLLARVLARHGAWTVADLVAETQARLLTVAAENRTVAAAFDLSYRDLAERRQRFFRRLGLHPGVAIDPVAAAVLTSTPLEEAAAHLDALHGDNLLVEIGYRRYAMHDLIRHYARALAATDPDHERDEAVRLLLDHYQHTAAAVDARLSRHNRPGSARPAATAAPVTAVPDLTERARALVWARTERDNLLACLAHTDDPRRVVALTAGLTELLRLDGPWNDAIRLHTTAADVARDLDDRIGRANALSELGIVRRLTDDYPGAAQDLQEALELYRELGDRLGQANVLKDLGILRRLTGDFAAAATTLREALESYRELGDRLGQANALMILGGVRRLTGDYRGAATDLHDAQRLYGEVGNQLGQANALKELGILRRLTGEFAAAATTLREALELYRELGDRLGQANALMILGGVRREIGDYPTATTTLTDALDLYRELGNRGGEVEALNETGTLQRVSGDLAGAATSHRQALHLSRRIGSAWDEAHALAGLGRCARATGQRAEAAAHFRDALRIFQRIGAVEAAQAAAELDATGADSDPVCQPAARNGAAPGPWGSRTEMRSGCDQAISGCPTGRA